MLVCKVKKVSTTAKIPTYAEPGAIGADLYADEEAVIPPFSRQLIKTGIAIEAAGSPMPPGYVRIAPRSGLSLKGIDVGAGVVDCSYRGEIKVVLINNSGGTFTVNRGDRIAQMIYELAVQMHFIEAISLGNTPRGTNGFGSTGK